MKINIYIFNKIKNQALNELTQYYLLLTSKYSKVELKSINYKAEAKIEYQIIQKYFQTGFNIVLSEDGREFNTTKFAQKLEQLKLEYSQINFFVGNAFGFEEEIKTKANLVLSLSQMTAAHELALVMLLEQLYRCLNLNSGGSYHK